MRVRHELIGEPLLTNRLHVTLCHLNDYAGLPADIVARAKEAAAQIVMPPFEVVFDRVGSFRGGKTNPLVLRGEAGVVALKTFQLALRTSLTRHGITVLTRADYTPHVTLLYDSRLVAEYPIESVGWKVREFVLIHSLLGKKQHVPLARWPLVDRPWRTQ